MDMYTHHAIVLHGNALDQVALPDAYMHPSTDVSHIVVDRFGVDYARTLAVEALQRPVLGEKRVFVVQTQDITIEAQNALLKLFEEPPATAQFFVVIPRERVLLLTLLSRMYVVEPDVQHTEDVVAKEFISASYAERMDMVAKMAKNKDTAGMEALVRAMEYYIAKGKQSDSKSLRSLLLVRKYFQAPGASKKMLLEELALSV